VRVGVDGDENAAGTGVVVGIAGLSANSNGRDHIVAGGVNDELPAARLVRDKHLLDRGNVVEPIGEADLADMGDDRLALRVNDGNIAAPGPGGKDATELRYS
jgi:hypothetical protein